MGRFMTYYKVVLYPALSIGIFLIFGITAEARAKYRRWFWAVANSIGLKPTHTVHIPRDNTSELMFSSLHSK